MPAVRILLQAVAALLVAVGSASAQSSPAHAPEPAVSAQADDLHALLRPREALETLEMALADGPEDPYPLLWRATREAVALGMLTGDDEARDTWYRQAEAWALRAVELEPEGVEGHLWLAIAWGRRALQEGPRTKVELAQRIRDEARFVLERDSLNAGAHEVLGQWHAQIMRLNGVTRFFAQRLLGADMFAEASWEAAERHLRRAVELEPRVLIHHLELGRVLVDIGERDEARAHLREVLERPALDPIDPLQKQAAQELLRDL